MGKTSHVSVNISVSLSNQRRQCAQVNNHRELPQRRGINLSFLLPPALSWRPLAGFVPIHRR